MELNKESIINYFKKGVFVKKHYERNVFNHKLAPATGGLVSATDDLETEWQPEKRKSVMLRLPESVIRHYKIKALEAGSGVKYASLIETELFNIVTYGDLKK